MTTVSKLNLSNNIRRCNYFEYAKAVNEIAKFIEDKSNAIMRAPGDKERLQAIITEDEAKQFLANYTQLSKMTPKEARLIGSMADGKGKLVDAITQFNTLRYDVRNPKVAPLFKVLGELYQIKPPIDFGSYSQQCKLRQLKAECKRYMNYLNKNYEPNNDPDAEFEIDTNITREQKYRLVESFLSALNDETVDIPKRLSNFEASIKQWKPNLSQHRDPFWLRFISNVLIILSSVALGAGLIYTYRERGTFNFFSSRGKLFVDEVSEISSYPDDNKVFEV